MLTTTDCENQMQIEGELHVPVVKNTFIEVKKPTRSTIRRHSVPADLCLLSDCEEVSSCDHSDAEASTDVSSDGCSESIFGSVSSDEALEQVAPVADPPRVRPNPKHVCAQRSYQEKCDSVIRRTAKALEDSDLSKSVFVSEDASEGSIVIRVRAEEGVSVESILVQAQKALLETTKQSKSIYIMGFSSPHPFIEHQSGFSATLGAMENATRACWHVFKKGFCRHGSNCSKQHPIYQTGVRVLVEKA
jgi:hypothetical protein